LEPECRVTLHNFSGPLDLLLHLIRKNRLDIADIPIALVTAQYLQYLEFMRALDVVVAGEYLVMAATLLQIKSRMLLPAQGEEEGDEEDPRQEIVAPLMELAAVKEAARRLEERPQLGRNVFVPPAPVALAPAGEGGADQGPVVLEVSLHDLAEALRRALGRRSLPRRVELERARVTVAQRMEELRAELKARPSLSLFELLTSRGRAGADHRPLKGWIIATFLAVLELARRREARLIQEEQGGDIQILRRS